MALSVDDAGEFLIKMLVTGAEGITVVDGSVGIEDDEARTGHDTELLSDEAVFVTVGMELRPLRLVLGYLLFPRLLISVEADADEHHLVVVLVSLDLRLQQPQL